jgi:hypothetical protein
MSRLQRVQVDVAGDIVAISWDEREALLKNSRKVAGLETVVQKFEAVGASRPVALDADEREALLSALRFLLEVGDRLPDGIQRLFVALVQDELRGDVGTPTFV